MYADIVLIEEPGAGMARITYDGDHAVWVLSQLRNTARARARNTVRTRPCAVTGANLEPGDVAYRPVGNQMYRSQRISLTGMQRLRDES